MRTKQIFNLLFVGLCIAGAGYLVRGNDLLSGLLLVLLAGLAGTKIVAALWHRRGGGGGGGGNSLGGFGAGRPVPRPPGRPPSLAAAAKP